MAATSRRSNLCTRLVGVTRHAFALIIPEFHFSSSWRNSNWSSRGAQAFGSSPARPDTTPTLLGLVRRGEGMLRRQECFSFQSCKRLAKAERADLVLKQICDRVDSLYFWCVAFFVLVLSLSCGRREYFCFKGVLVPQTFPLRPPVLPLTCNTQDPVGGAGGSGPSGDGSWCKTS